MKNGLLGVLVVFVILMIYSCANMASPNGGPPDEDPPKVISSNPIPNETNFTGKKIEIVFDELIQIENPTENVIITPPQRNLPVIRAQGRKAIVELKDTLRENTTYTIDFTSSIADNNEKNVLENFSFAFSTGDVIDTLEVSGILLNASDLEPVAGITIGLHENLEDSAFRTEPFLRTSRTNDRGRFTIRNIAPGTYRLYALNDLNRDYMFDQPGEDIAFLDSLIVPSFEIATRQDTIWADLDSLAIDTVYVREYTRFVPDDIKLRLFREEFFRQYMTRPERAVENKFTLKFNEPVDSVPDPVPLNFTPPEEDWYVAQTADQGRTIHYWITDSLIWKKDTLQLEINYLKTDSLNLLQPQIDTIQLVMRNRPQPAKKKSKKEEEEPEPVEFLGMTINASGSKDTRDTISITFNEPVLGLEKEVFNFQQKIDTLFYPVDFEFFQDTTNSLNYFIHRYWRYGEEYRLEIDSAAIYSVYGKWNDTYKSDFKLKERDEYGHLYINVIGVDLSIPSFIELLNKSDAPIRKAEVVDGGALFMDLKPDTYYARLILDRNNNGKWDTGNYEQKLQPEEVFYCPKPLEVMQNWEVEENWVVTAEPIEKQKPLDITKNKPKETAPRNNRNNR